MSKNRRSFANSLAVLLAIATSSTGASAKDRDRGAISVELFGGAYVRTNTGFVDHAQVFGYDFRGSGGGGIDAGYEVVRRLSIHASWSAYTMAATRSFSELRVTSQAVLLTARYAIFRQRWPFGRSTLMTQVEGTLGGGYYLLRETYDDPTLYPRAFDHKRPGAGVRGGVNAAIYYGAFGIVVGYAFQYSPAHAEDNLGGKIYAGGHEITFGLSLRF